MSIVQRFSRNTAGRDLIVGDIHGCFSKLRDELDRAGFDPERDRLFSVGDMVDRGPQSADVLEWLYQPWFYAISGNHEQMAVEFANGTMGADMYGINGGHWLIGMLPDERMPYIDNFRGLPVAIELETEQGLVGLVHADITHKTWDEFKHAVEHGPERQAVIDLAQWGRIRISQVHEFGDVGGVRAIVCGHTPIDERMRRVNNVHYIDSGAWLKGGTVKNRFTIIDAATLQLAS